nr:MAG: replication associated protein [Arizlama virus]
MSKQRDFCFTINNPTDSDYIELKHLEEEAKFYCYGKETGETSTFHLQGFVMFSNQRTLRGVSRLLTRAHLEKRRGTPQQAIEYCAKDGDFYEWGERPIAGKTTKERHAWCISMARQGYLDRIEVEEPGMYLRYLSTFRSLRERESSIITADLDNEWWTGPTGTGKSRKLWAEYPDHFPKSLNKWWDGYENQDVVALEELNPDNGKWIGSFLKIWSDRYPFNAEIKGGTLKLIRPKKFVVCSNYSIEECFPNDQDLLPLKRRFKVTRFNTL